MQSSTSTAQKQAFTTNLLDRLIAAGIRHTDASYPPRKVFDCPVCGDDYRLWVAEDAPDKLNNSFCCTEEQLRDWLKVNHPSALGAAVAALDAADVEAREPEGSHDEEASQSQGNSSRNLQAAYRQPGGNTPGNYYGTPVKQGDHRDPAFVKAVQRHWGFDGAIDEVFRTEWAGAMAVLRTKGGTFMLHTEEPERVMTLAEGECMRLLGRHVKLRRDAEMAVWMKILAYNAGTLSLPTLIRFAPCESEVYKPVWEAVLLIFRVKMASGYDLEEGTVLSRDFVSRIATAITGSEVSAFTVRHGIDHLEKKGVIARLPGLHPMKGKPKDAVLYKPGRPS